MTLNLQMFSVLDFIEAQPKVRHLCQAMRISDRTAFDAICELCAIEKEISPSYNAPVALRIRPLHKDGAVGLELSYKDSCCGKKAKRVQVWS